MNFYVDTFNGSPVQKAPSKITLIKRYPDGITEGPMAGMGGKVLTGIFELAGHEFICLDGGPVFTFDRAAISFQIECENQAELDYYTNKMSADPAAEQCGWIKDKFGIAWQITPRVLGEMLNDKDSEKAGRVMQAMLEMKRINIAGLEKAYTG